MGQRPNILWMSLESVRADHTSLYGYDLDTTPRLKALSERSDATLLSPAISASMWTPASTASMLTGTHMSTHQVGQSGSVDRKLTQSIETLPEMLAKDGYHTSLFSTNPYISHETGLGRGFQHSELLRIKKGDLLGFDALTRDKATSVIQSVLGSSANDPRRWKIDAKSSQNKLLKHRFRRWETSRDDNSPFFSYIHVPSPPPIHLN